MAHIHARDDKWFLLPARHDDGCQWKCKQPQQCLKQCVLAFCVREWREKEVNLTSSLHSLHCFVLFDTATGTSSALANGQTNVFGENNQFQLGATSTVTLTGNAGGAQDILDQSPGMNPKVSESMLTQCVNEHICPKQKFIILDEELDFGGELQRCMLNKLKIQGLPEEFWWNHKEIVRKKPSRKQNNVQEACKENMMGE